MTMVKVASSSVWAKFSGPKRISAELKSIQKSSALSTQLFDFAPVNDDLYCWRFKVKNFDDDIPAGKQLNRELQELANKCGQDYILMEILFPADYPTNPFFLRVVSPRCVMYTGHVTAGGSICIEALVATGGPGGWQPGYGVEGILVLVLANMLHAEVTIVRTATGPGGTSGPLRLDLSQGLSEYSMWEAQAAFSRTLANHGWSSRAGAAAAGASGTAAPRAPAGPSPSGVLAMGPTAPMAAVVPAVVTATTAATTAARATTAATTAARATTAATTAARATTAATTAARAMTAATTAARAMTAATTAARATTAATTAARATTAATTAAAARAAATTAAAGVAAATTAAAGTTVPWPTTAATTAARAAAASIAAVPITTVSLAPVPTRVANSGPYLTRSRTRAASASAVAQLLNGVGVAVSAAPAAAPVPLRPAVAAGGPATSVAAVGVEASASAGAAPGPRPSSKHDTIVLLDDDDEDGGGYDQNHGAVTARRSRSTRNTRAMALSSPRQFAGPIPMPTSTQQKQRGTEEYAVVIEDDENQDVDKADDDVEAAQASPCNTGLDANPKTASGRRPRVSGRKRRPDGNAVVESQPPGSGGLPKRANPGSIGAVGAAGGTSVTVDVVDLSADTVYGRRNPHAPMQLELDVTRSNPTADDAAAGGSTAAAAKPRRRKGTKNGMNASMDIDDGVTMMDLTGPLPGLMNAPPAQVPAGCLMAGSGRSQVAAAAPPAVTRSAGGAADARIQVPGEAQLAADAALAAMVAQLEEAKAKLEEEKRAKQRLEEKMQDLAAQALLSKRLGGLGASASGPSTAAGAGGAGPGPGASGYTVGDELLAAPPPPYWDTILPEERSGVKMVVLPLKGDPLAGTSKVAAAGPSKLAKLSPLNPDDVTVLVENGLSEKDATDLLNHCDGNLEEACTLAIEAADCGGITALLGRRRKEAATAAGSSGGRAGAAAEEADAKAKRLEAELERVLARFEKASGLSRSGVVRVERVQNQRLWTKYCIRRKEIEARLLETGAATSSTRAGWCDGVDVNEYFLWHGTSVDVVQLVVKDGFDLREANRFGVLGEGVYFAANASYSVSYSTRTRLAPLPPPGQLPSLGIMLGSSLQNVGVGGNMPQSQLLTTIPSTVPGHTPNAAFPGTAGAIMLCRVALGTLALGACGIRKPPLGSDSVYMTGTLNPGTLNPNNGKPVTTSQHPRTKGAGKKGAAAAVGVGELVDPIWDVGSALGDNLIVAIFDNSQAYPEYVVHFNKI
ncbi:hypothetical protein Vafri_16872 [Volvox africanus]|uniref:Poly [ADP-ribose] polymerase n=1 Tax=Volvox africanus TaxID=51714 RepID=A0A8J4BPC6_9CHLO|nr:hypothetical protein Vafri_16872 [Volvox africanus]